MTARGEVSGPLPPQAGRITGSRIVMASGTHGELVTGGAGATLEGRAATRTGPASSDIPRDRNAREIQGAVLSSLFALKKKKKKSPAPLTNDHETSISSSHSQRDSILRRTFFLCSWIHVHILKKKNNRRNWFIFVNMFTIFDVFFNPVKGDAWDNGEEVFTALKTPPFKFPFQVDNLTQV